MLLLMLSFVLYSFVQLFFFLLIVEIMVHFKLIELTDVSAQSSCAQRRNKRKNEAISDTKRSKKNIVLVDFILWMSWKRREYIECVCDQTNTCSRTISGFVELPHHYFLYLPRPTMWCGAKRRSVRAICTVMSLLHSIQVLSWMRSQRIVQRCERKKKKNYFLHYYRNEC